MLETARPATAWEPAPCYEAVIHVPGIVFQHPAGLFRLQSDIGGQLVRSLELRADVGVELLPPGNALGAASSCDSAPRIRGTPWMVLLIEVVETARTATAWEPAPCYGE